MNPHDKEQFLNDLVSVIDGDPIALERYADLMADSPELRDLHFEAAEAAKMAAGAGADYVPPADMEQRVLAAIESRGQAAGESGTDPAPVSQWAPQNGAGSDEVRHIATASQPVSSPNSQRGQSHQEAQAHQGRRSKIAWIGAGVLGVSLAAAAAIALVVSGSAPVLDGAIPVATELSGGFSLSATVERLIGGGESGSETGLLLGDEGTVKLRLQQGAAVPRGGVIATDNQTRAEFRLSDGSLIVLDRDTEVVIGAQGRSVELRHGQLLAEVEHHDDAPNARFETPSGVIEVIGTKFLLSANDGEASVRVTQGVVRVSSNGEHVEVKVGQEALMRRGQGPVVVPATNIAESIEWSELDTQEDDLPTPGLGELRAHRPGEREEQERPLSLAEHSVTVRIVGNVARTEIAERFQNDSDDELEGVYSFPIPAGARIASLQLKVDGEWQEGAFVSKERAAQIWRGVIRNATAPQLRREQEEFIWVPGPWRDPALLEWQQGGRFKLRIFPIPAHGSREIRLSYEQTVQPYGEGRRYVYPLPMNTDGSTEIGRFEVDVRVAGSAQAKARGYEMATVQESGAQRLRYTADQFLPSGDIIIDYHAPDDDAEMRVWTYQGGDATASPPERTREDADVLREQRALDADERGYALFALRPELPGWEQASARDYVLVVDSSQSMVGERYERVIRLAEGIAGEMDRQDRIFAVACDVTCRPLDGGPRLPSSAAAAAITEFLRKEDPAGASDIAASLRSAVQLAHAAGAGQERPLNLIYLGDGIASVGHRRAGSLAAEVSELVAQSSMGEAPLSLTTVGIGQDADARTLAAMARAGGGQFVPYMPGQRSTSAAISVLETTYGAILRDATLTWPDGIVAVAPVLLPSLRSGQEFLVSARVQHDGVRGDVVLRGKLGGRVFEQHYPIELALSTSAGNAFVPRLWATKTIESLEDAGRSEDTSRVVALSKTYGVMSRSTSLLVLESDAMFRAFGVDRARPTLQWTGEEEDMEYSTSSGTQTLGGLDLASRLVGGRGSGAGAPTTRTRRAPQASAMRMQMPVVEAVTVREEMVDEDVVSREVQARDTAAPFPPVPGQGRRMRRRMPNRGGFFMRRVAHWEGRIQDSVSNASDLEAVRAAEQALEQNPDSRDRQRTLVRALSRAGEVGRAVEAAEAWLERDRLDWEALTYLSDAVGRQGDQVRALRLLSGIVDLEPNNEILQRRMANAFDRAGDSERACAHRVALAEIDSSSRSAVAAAIRCERELGRASAADRVLSLAPSSRRSAVTTEAARPAPAERVAGDLMASATWSGNVDLDITIVTPQGTRISWMGGRRNVVGRDGHSTSQETLGLRRAGAGRYIVEISRANPFDQTPISGSIELEGGDSKRTISFDLQGVRQVVGQIEMLRRWRRVRVRR